MTELRPIHPRGGAPVGYVSDLDAVGAAAVLYLRMWNDGRTAQEAVRRDFEQFLGRDQGRSAATALERLCEMSAHHGRRPLMRHSVGCQCLGADESCFATFIATAGEGNREDAILFAMNLIRADLAPQFAGLAETLGLSLARLALLVRKVDRAPTEQKTLH